MASRPRLRRVEPGRYETRDRRFVLERRSYVGPRGGTRYEWVVDDVAYPTLDAAALSLLAYIRGWSGLSQESGTVYLIHFDEPFGHAKHYLGWTNAESVAERLETHRAGRGANLLRHVNNAGISYEVVRLWPGGRARERQLKKQGGASRICPVCKAQPSPGPWQAPQPLPRPQEAPGGQPQPQAPAGPGRPLSPSQEAPGPCWEEAQPPAPALPDAGP